VRIDFTILRSTLGQRIFYLFVVCALLPIGILALVSFRSVARELQEQSERRLRELAKAQVMSIVERLSLLEVELQAVKSCLAQKLRLHSLGYFDCLRDADVKVDCDEQADGSRICY